MYTFNVEQNGNAFGFTHKFIGPGLSRYTNKILLIQPLNDWAAKYDLEYRSAPGTENNGIAFREAQRIAGMLDAAYEAGRKSMQEDIRKALGIYR